jgi:LacI family gluconate utilization system Gnt-I transcriptional repressor
MAVPDQMAIVGFNDLEFMASSVPTLTSVRTNRYEMGRNAAQMVIETLEGRRPEQGVVDLGFSIVQRESSKRA